MAPHVCIIGAGVSGLRLPKAIQWDLERIGCTGYNPIIELAKETGTPLHRWKESTLMFDSEGHLVGTAEANKALKRVWEILETASEYSKNYGDKADSSTSLYRFYQDWCNWAIQSGDIDQREAELVLGMSQMWGAYVDDCFIPTNYQKIVAKISAVPLAQATMLFDTTMVSVEARPDGPRPVCVTTSDGNMQCFDDVVVTTPLGWLKQHKESISQLEPRIASAIDSISFGRLEKVLIEFPSAFWESEPISLESDFNDAVSFVHWLSPIRTSQTVPRKWRLECVSFNAFHAPYRRSILLFYTFGECSTFITSSIRKLDGKVRDQWLQEFFEPYYSLLPGYAENTCAPLRFLATEWCNDEYAGNGSYSNFQVGMSDAARDVEAIRHGMPEQHIYFAGEHTAPFDGLGTVAGAYTSGEKIGKRIIESWQPSGPAIDGCVPEKRSTLC
ncbi:MAG: hypothetical protein Q9200_003036 [Gallowayella weberi]